MAMAERRALVLPADLVQKLDLNRGEMGRAEFVQFLLDNLLQEQQAKGISSTYVTRQDLEAFKADTRALLRSFLDFFLVYGLELGATPKREDFHALEQRLREAVDQPKPGGTSSVA